MRNEVQVMGMSEVNVIIHTWAKKKREKKKCCMSHSGKTEGSTM